MRGAHPARSAASTSGIDVGALFDAHTPFLLRVVERLAGPGPHVEDVVQEVFLTAHRKRYELDPTQNLKAWLYRVAVNLVRHHHRSFARQRALSDKARSYDVRDELSTPDSEAARLETARRVRACVERLPLAHREVFVLFELEDVEGREIAKLVGIPENTVWTRLHHARDKFRKLWTAELKRRRSADASG